MSWTANDGVRYGIVVPQGWRDDLQGRDFEAMVAVAQETERVGFDSIWLYDHLQTRDEVVGTMFECWTSLAALARETSRVRLGQIVTCALYRNPGLLAEMAATVDDASGGRLVLGLGAGWDETEYRTFGFGDDYPTVGERLRRLDETLRVVTRRFSGRFPERRPPLLVGGSGERVLLKLVARRADACNFTDSRDPDFYRHKLAVLRKHCDDVGRDYEEILRTASFTVSVDELGRGELRPMFERLASAGISYFVVYVDPPTDLAALGRLAAEVGL